VKIGRYRQVLRRGHQPEAETVGKTEGREKEDEADWQRRDPAEGVSGCVEIG
jgi:hypothetical protein